MSILFRDQPSESRSTVRLPYPFNTTDLAAQMRGSSSVNVTTDTAMRHDAVWSCRTRIAEDVSMMPVDVIRYVNGTRQEVAPVPQIIAAPSVTTADPMDWRYQVVMSWTGDGNAWGLVTQTSGSGQYPTRIELQNHRSVRIQAVDNRVRFFVDNVEEELWPVGRLWHAPAYTVPGQLLGLSPIQYHAAIIGKGMAAGLHGFQYLSDGAHPTSIWKLQGANAEQAKTFKDRLMGLASGNREPMVVDANAVSMEQLQSNPSDSQFLETEKYSVEQVCRIFNCDPADHGSSSGGSSITYANRSDADLARLKRRQYWVTKLQNVLTSFLPRPQVVKLNTSVSLMMTDMERHQLHALRLKSKTRTINEVRRIEDERPFPGDEYDEPGVPGVDSVDTPDDPLHDVMPDPARYEQRAIEPVPAPSFTVHNHIPEGRDIVIPAPEVSVDVAAPEVRVDAPVVNVNVPEQRMDAPVVNVTVDPTPVTIENNNQIDVAPATVPAATVTIMPADDTPSVFKVRRDGQGRITEVEEKG